MLRRARLPLYHTLSVVDLGWGTGLASPLLKPLASELVGVDLSPLMIEVAKRRGMYEELIEGDIESYLNGQRERFDLIASADTLVYFGDLENVFRGAADSLRPGGRFVFTTELGGDLDDEPGYRLNPTGRGCHAEPSGRRTLAENGLELIACRSGFLRLEGARPVNGLVILARKAGDA